MVLFFKFRKVSLAILVINQLYWVIQSNTVIILRYCHLTAITKSLS